MEMSGMMGGLYRICEWIMRVAALNLLWLLFTLLGLVVFGIFPATAALFAVARQFIRGNDVPIIKTYWQYFKADVIKVNLLGYVFVAIGYILYIDFQFLQLLEGYLQVVLNVGLIIVTSLFIITSIYLLPVYVHFDVKFFQYIKYAFIIGITHPFRSIGILLGGFALFYVMTLMPGLIIFFSVSGFIFWIVIVTNQTFEKLEKQAEKLRMEEEEANTDGSSLDVARKSNQAQKDLISR